MRRSIQVPISGRCQARTRRDGACNEKTDLVVEGEWRCPIHIKGEPRWKVKGKFKTVYLCATCPAHLANDNSGEQCSRCDRERRDAEILHDPRAKATQAARRAAIVFATTDGITDFPTYLNALTDALDDVCRATGIEPPVFA